jgi:hypothetical protein
MFYQLCDTNNSGQAFAHATFSVSDFLKNVFLYSQWRPSICSHHFVGLQLNSERVLILTIAAKRLITPLRRSQTSLKKVATKVHKLR